LIKEHDRYMQIKHITNNHLDIDAKRCKSKEVESTVDLIYLL